jgi:hypothetical protein
MVFTFTRFSVSSPLKLVSVKQLNSYNNGPGVPFGEYTPSIGGLLYLILFLLYSFWTCSVDNTVSQILTDDIFPLNLPYTPSEEYPKFNGVVVA